MGAWAGADGRAYQVVLGEPQRAELQRRVRAWTTAQRDTVRARIILACAQEGRAATVERHVGVHPRTVERWRARFRRAGLPGLQDRHRPGPPAKFEPVTRLESIALACEPVEREDGRTTRPIAALVQEAAARDLVPRISRSSYQRILPAGELRPHRVRGWLHSPDPEFREKVTTITDLYLHPPAGAGGALDRREDGHASLGVALPGPPRGPWAARDGGSSRTRVRGPNRCSVRSRCTAAGWWATVATPARRPISWAS